MKRRFLNETAILLALVCTFVAHDGTCAALPAIARRLPENWEARLRLRDTIFAPVRQAAAESRKRVLQPESGDRVSFKTDVQGGALYFIFANQRGDGSLATAGNFIIKRSLKDGSFLQAKVFVQDDPGCFLRFFPRGERTSMDIFLFDELFQKNILLPISFDGLLTASLSRIMELGRSSVDWAQVLPPEPTSGDERLARMVQELRPLLPRLPDGEDGAMDRDGRLVFIATGSAIAKGGGGFNCSGFAKWVVDGFYKPLTGAYMDISPLKERGPRRGHRSRSPDEEERDPYFGLDWSRNLARVLSQARTGMLPSPHEVDVSDADRFPYFEEAGYPVRSVRAVLYFLARRNPGTIYLGSVNRAGYAITGTPGTPYPSTAGDATDAESERRHHHVVVLFPFFDEKGEFRIVVMERNVETSAESLRSRYGQEYISLVRLDSTGEFVPPKID